MSERSTQVGRALAHESAHGHVTGEARYTDDLLPRTPEALHAWPVQSVHAHARVVSVDTEAAQAVVGVVAVLSAASVPPGGQNQVGAVRLDEPLFPDEVSHHGQPVVWVLGETLEAAREGAAAVVVDYEVLPAILTMAEALAAKSTLSEAMIIVSGEPEAALANAPRRLEGELEIGGQEHFYLETQAALATWDEAGGVFVHSSTQHPSETQHIVARVLGLPAHAVTCQSLRMGGAFGGKEVQANPIAAVAALGAKVTGRPVRVRLDRQRDMQITGKRHPFWGRYRVGFDDEGRLLALDVALYSDGGWSMDLSKPIMYRALFHIDNCYRLPNLRVVGRVLRTNKTSQTAFRGFGGPQGMVVIEEIVDRVARAVGRPAHEVRALNFYRPGDCTHYGQEVRDADRIARIWDALMTSAQVEARRAEVDRANATCTHEKRGLAITPVKFGISFTTSFLNQAGALVLIYADGSVQVNHGGTEMGQGLHTKMMQIAADGLGVPLSSVRLMPTRTDKVPNTSATAASSGSDLNGAAVEIACTQLRERLAAVAGRMLDLPPADLRFAQGRVFPFWGEPTGERSQGFAEVVARAYLERVQLFAAGYYRTPEIHYDEQLGRGKPFHYYCYGAAVTEVAVDGFTGQYEIVRVDVLHDVGRSISPLIDRGQIEGGYIQGLGWLTCEELVWNEQGALATRGASTYKLPSLGECPEVFNVELLAMADEPKVVKGSKAVGEPPFMLAISAREALREAVAAFAPEGAPASSVALDCPSTPEAVYWAIEALRGDGRS
ncbi:xanthine dehydrogenase molybdopterin binding subunit [Pseudenhygromyxa sp. WMMC2535]|uniref:xanthine dehydrogenase molybdopterin binding subunit n=1 Tax=Pseudenhygromyxa sp. WMMC2535 TaxID=2712867 RepID=UPI001552E5EF|nr:xanthine dehydrogenase molybdopterin binding subunit [Pseudenhygromyxa sp. WMMC2535]NVB36724.1 xanthine dehydrogenase molybdopterin binding subunit [Pseudenhygromyxa sp. WMMC2535]